MEVDVIGPLFHRHPNSILSFNCKRPSQLSRKWLLGCRVTLFYRETSPLETLIDITEVYTWYDEQPAAAQPGATGFYHRKHSSTDVLKLKCLSQGGLCVGSRVDIGSRLISVSVLITRLSVFRPAAQT